MVRRPDDTQALWQEFKHTGDQAARDRLILTYAPLVKYVAGRLGSGLPAHVDEGDLVSYGLLGLIGSSVASSPTATSSSRRTRSRGSRLHHRRAALHGLGAALVRARAREIERAIAFEGRLAQAPTDRGDRRLARDHRGGAPGLAARDLADVDRRARRALVELLPRRRPRRRHHYDRRPHRGGAQDAMAHTELREALGEAIARLPEREKLVVTLYYYEELTLREIGEVLGVTESRVSQLHTKAILRLKARLSGHARPRDAA